MSPEMRTAWWYSLKVFLAVRIAIAIIGIIAVGTLPQRGVVDAPGWPDRVNEQGLHNAATSLDHQDALWFQRIAHDGYAPDDASAAFFPGYPLVVRAVSAVVRDTFTAAMLVSNLAFLLALVLLFDLTRRERSEEAARRTVLYLAIFPTSFFLAAPYSESLFLLLAVATFRAARGAGEGGRRRWPLAGLIGIGAALTRSLGVMLAPALAAEALQSWKEERGAEGRQRRLAVGLAAAAIIPLGMLLYLGFWHRFTGDALAPLHAQSNWLREAAFPPAAIARAIGLAVSDTYLFLDVLIVIPCLILAVMTIWRTRWGYAVYTWLGIVIPLALVWPDRPLMSMPRFLLLLFPIFWILADLTIRRRIPHALVVGVSSGGLALMTTLFVNNYYVF